MIFVEVFVLLFAILVSIPLIVVAIELLVTLLRTPEEYIQSGVEGNYTILMPAHNESSIIKHTLTKLISSGVPADTVVVVADNCTDNTAQIVREQGAIALERFDSELRGKGYALDFGLAYLKKTSQPDVVIILDADCEISLNALNLLTSQCLLKKKPVQAIYLMRNKVSSSLKQRVVGFAWLVKNMIRPLAVNQLGIPVTLTGTGMAFPWHVISKINVAHGNIVEDMQLGIDCSLMGAPPVLCEQAVVYSDFPELEQAAQTQRTRWEHGHLLTITQQVPKLLKSAIIKKDWKLLALALDIGVPPLALLVMIAFVSLLLLVGYSIFADNHLPLFILFVCISFFTITLVTTWLKFGRDYLTISEACLIPLYVVSKLSVYFRFISNRQTKWIRTDRTRK